MNLVSTPKDIERLDRTTQSLVDWSPIPLGSILRTHAYSYPNWGILLTTANIEWIVAMSKAAYGGEWTETDASMNDLIVRACKAANMLDANVLLNRQVARFGTDALKRHTSHLRVIDVGAGPGGTSAAFLAQLAKSGVIGVELHLLEPSQKRIVVATERLHRYAERHSIHTHLGTVADIAQFPRHFADLVITNAAIHHESFNTHLPNILRVMKPGTQFVSGDWHEGTYESPARAYWVYYILQNPFQDHSNVYNFIKDGTSVSEFQERDELREFRQLFGLNIEDVVRAFDGLSQSERAASAGGIRYWHEMGKHLIFEGKGRKSPEVLIQCHERVAKRLEALKNAGFVFDKDDRSKYKELLKRRGYGELTAVMVARKLTA